MIRTVLALAIALAGVSPAQACVDYAAEPGRLTELESAAGRGALTDAEKDCLEQAYASASEQTVKDKISRVLLVNAYAYSTSVWAELVRRHLDEVDRSDPDIAYLYAFYLFNTDPGRAEEVIRWTEVALERKDVWTGDVYVGRVYGLMKLRAVAANRLWMQAEEERAEGAEVADIDRLRNETKTYAREWVDFAKVAGRDVQESLQLCLSAATRAVACGVQE